MWRYGEGGESENREGILMVFRILSQTGPGLPKTITDSVRYNYKMVDASSKRHGLPEIAAVLHTFCGLCGEVPSVYRTFPWLQILAAKPGWK